MLQDSIYSLEMVLSKYPFRNVKLFLLHRMKLPPVKNYLEKTKIISLKTVSPPPSRTNPYFSKNLMLAVFLLRTFAMILENLRPSERLTKDVTNNNNNNNIPSYNNQ